MCMSRLHRVVSIGRRRTRSIAADIDGSTHRLSLLAYEGDPPQPGDWVVAHSGYALGPADRAEAEAVLAEYRAGIATGLDGSTRLGAAMATSSATAGADPPPGCCIAGTTAIISGISVFVNSYGVRSFTSPAVYTTAKNLVAAVMRTWPRVARA